MQGNTKTIDPSSDLCGAVASLSSGDTLILKPGVYKIARHIVVDKDVVIKGSTGAAKDADVRFAERKRRRRAGLYLIRELRRGSRRVADLYRMPRDVRRTERLFRARRRSCGQAGSLRGARDVPRRNLL